MLAILSLDYKRIKIKYPVWTYTADDYKNETLYYRAGSCQWRLENCHSIFRAFNKNVAGASYQYLTMMIGC
jgi:hypothetical protein